MNTMRTWQAKVSKSEEIIKTLQKKKLRRQEASEVLSILAKVERILERVNHGVDDEIRSITTAFNKENKGLVALISKRRRQWLNRNLEEKVWEHERLKARIAYAFTLIKALDTAWRNASTRPQAPQPISYKPAHSAFSLYS